MPVMRFPDARFRSPTASDGQGDIRDENIFSALVLQHSGAGQQKIFTVPAGQSIPTLGGSSSAPVPTHHKTYTEVSTNLNKAGELGSAIGDAAIRAIGVTIEQTAYTLTTGVSRAFGANQFEVADILSKTFFQLRIAGKLQLQGPTWSFPAPGGNYGSISTTGTNATASVSSNGWPGFIRKLKTPIMVARTDTLEGTVGVAGSATLAFSATGADGQPCLVTYLLHTDVKGDVR